MIDQPDDLVDPAEEDTMDSEVESVFARSNGRTLRRHGEAAS